MMTLMIILLFAAAFVFYWFVIKSDSKTTPSPSGGTTPVLIEPKVSKLVEWAISKGTGVNNYCRFNDETTTILTECVANCHDGGNPLAEPYYPTPWTPGPTLKKTSTGWNIEYASETIPLTENISKADYCKEFI